MSTLRAIEEKRREESSSGQHGPVAKRMARILFEHIANGIVMRRVVIAPYGGNSRHDTESSPYRE